MKTTYTELLAMTLRRLRRHRRAAYRAEIALDFTRAGQHEVTIVNCDRLIAYIHDACF